MDELQNGSALSGIKVIDFSWSVVGPSITAFLSYYGAEVIKVESIHAPEVTRRSAPFQDNIVGIDRSRAFPTLNTNKYSLSLNMRHPKSQYVIEKLIQRADIVVQSATESTLEKLGLDYQYLKNINNKIIVLNTTNQGQTGPCRNHPGYGDSSVALAGFPEVTGWPDHEPSLPPGAYTDSVTPWFGSLAILAALLFRDDTETGQHIDLSQLEAGLHMLLPAFVMYSANNFISRRDGNRSLTDAPHGVYKCRGEERWCAIAITNDDEWGAFCKAIGNPSWTKDEQFSTMPLRKQNENELDKLVEGWTKKLTPDEIVTTLQAAGVPSGVVENIGDLHDDIEIKHRGHFQSMEHPVIGDYTVDLPPARFSTIATSLRRPAPQLGEHTEYVMCQLLKVDEEKFIELYSENVFE